MPLMTDRGKNHATDCPHAIPFSLDLLEFI